MKTIGTTYLKEREVRFRTALPNPRALNSDLGRKSNESKTIGYTIAIGLVLGLGLFCTKQFRSQNLTQVNLASSQVGTVNITINPQNPLMLHPSQKNIRLQLGKSTNETIHFDLNVVSAWQLLIGPSEIKDAVTHESMQPFVIGIGVNGGELQPLETMKIIASGSPSETRVDLAIGILPINAAVPVDVSRGFQCDLNFNLVGVL